MAEFGMEVDTGRGPGRSAGNRALVLSSGRGVDSDRGLSRRFPLLEFVGADVAPRAARSWVTLEVGRGNARTRTRVDDRGACPEFMSAVQQWVSRQVAPEVVERAALEDDVPDIVVVRVEGEAPAALVEEVAPRADPG